MASPLLRSEGLRPSDSPTRSLARRGGLTGDRAFVPLGPDPRSSQFVKRCAAALATALLCAVVVAQAPDQRKPQTPAQRAAERIRALQREAEALVAPGEPAARRAAEARARSADQGRGDRRIDRAAAGDVAAAGGRGGAGRRASQDRGRAIGPTSKRVSCSSTSSGRAGYWRLLLDVDDLRSLGRSTAPRRR